MTESKVNPENFVTVQGWMITDLKLKGNELLVYACIYGFSQAENQAFTGSRQYLADWTNSTVRGVSKCLKSLVEKGYILKTDKVLNGVTFCEYRAVNKVPQGGTKFTGVGNNVPGGGEQSSSGGGEQSSPNNIDIKIKDISTMFNTICVSLPKVRSLTDGRKKAIKERMKDYTSDDFKLMFEMVERSDFLTGKNESGWTATFDWLLKEGNMAKVLEGNYANKAKPVKQPEKMPTSNDAFMAKLQSMYNRE